MDNSTAALIPLGVKMFQTGSEKPMCTSQLPAPHFMVTHLQKLHTAQQALLAMSSYSYCIQLLPIKAGG